jgi:hypothetical protein
MQETVPKSCLGDLAGSVNFFGTIGEEADYPAQILGHIAQVSGANNRSASWDSVAERCFG